MRIIKVKHDIDSRNKNENRISDVIDTFEVEPFLAEIEKMLAKVEDLNNLDYLHFGLPLYNTRTLTKIFMGSKLKQSSKKIAIYTAQALIDKLKYEKLKIDILSIEEAREKFPNSRNISLGSYTLHPMDRYRLTPLEYYHRNLALEKDDELIVILSKLGAKSLKIIDRTISSHKVSTEIEGGLKNKTVSLEAGTEVSFNSDKLKELEVLYEGNYHEILESVISNSVWYANDSRINAIYENRKLNKNKIQKFYLRNTYSESFNFDFDLAAKVIKTGVDLKAEYDLLRNKERIFEVYFV